MHREHPREATEVQRDRVRRYVVTVPQVLDHAVVDVVRVRPDAPADMRRSFDGLAALARNHLEEDPAGGDWFVFVNRRRTIVKVLSFDGGG